MSYKKLYGIYSPFLVVHSSYNDSMVGGIGKSFYYYQCEMKTTETESDVMW